MTQAKSGDEASLEQLSMQLQALEDKLNRYIVTEDDLAAANKVARASGCSGCYTGPCFSPACQCQMCQCPMCQCTGVPDPNPHPHPRPHPCTAMIYSGPCVSGPCGGCWTCMPLGPAPTQPAPQPDNAAGDSGASK
jgi:hypothetical protein